MIPRARFRSSFSDRSRSRNQILRRAAIEALEGRTLLTAAPTVSGGSAIDEGYPYTLSLAANVTGGGTVQNWLATDKGPRIRGQPCSVSTLAF